MRWVIFASATFLAAAGCSKTPIFVDDRPGGGGASGAGGGSGSGAKGSASTGPIGTGGGPTGTPCISGNECQTGHCVDGFCCDSACTGKCMACAGTLHAGDPADGSCLPATAGTDPHTDCAVQPSSTCGRDGVCNGSGACRKYVVGTECAAQTCANGVQASEQTCSGDGICRAGTNQACAPYICVADACGTSCSVDLDCATGSFCVAPTCVAKKPPGTACSGDLECASAVCFGDQAGTGNVCCAASCAGSCNFCGTTGACSPRCPNCQPSGCSGANACDGAGQCKLAQGQACAAGTDCASGTCTTGVCG